MALRENARWHRESWNRFVREDLPRMIGDRIELSGYSVEEIDPYRLRITCGLSGEPAVFPHIPRPDGEGRFFINGEFLTVVPEAYVDDTGLKADCCGDQAASFLLERWGEAPRRGEGRLLRAWLSLDKLLDDFFHERAQLLDRRNWLAVSTHLNRVRFSRGPVIWHEGFPRRLDPVECPEGPNMGRVYTVAAGADIRDRVILPAPFSPARDSLGQAGRMIPFLEHDDAARALMGANMMRQWIEPANGESPLVVTGLEGPDKPKLGFNLLTAFVSLGADTFEDGLVLSRSAAERMGYADPIAPGDKFSNRHGQKGVVSAIWEDRDMPRLPDGRILEMAVSFIGVHARMNFGQILEAAAGLSARHTGEPFVAAPFESPGPEGVISSPLPDFCNDQAMVRLIFPGREAEAFSAAGYVYWGLTVHRGRSLLRLPEEGPQRVGAMEYSALLEAGAFRTARAFATDQNRDGSSFERLKALLERAEINLERVPEGVRLSFAEPGEGTPLCPHPWTESRGLHTLPGGGEAAALAEKLRSSDLFSALIKPLEERLSRAVNVQFSGILDRRITRPGNGISPSGRGVIAPGDPNRSLNDLGVPHGLFKALGLKKGEGRILFNRAPTFRPASVLALRPYPVSGPALRMHPLLCPWMNADYDGDQGALFLPLDGEARRELESTLTPEAHLRRNPALAAFLVPAQESLLGLCRLSRTGEGMERIVGEMGADLPPGGSLKESLEKAFARLLAEEGAAVLISRAERLFCLGLDGIACRGDSISPLAGSDLNGTDHGLAREIIEGASAEERRYYAVQREAVLSGARGTVMQLAQLLASVGRAERPDGTAFLSEGSRYAGLDGETYQSLAAGMRQGFLVLSREIMDLKYVRGYNLSREVSPRGHSFLARAMRSDQPGRVYAHAAANGEVDPLIDPWAALFCGELPRR